MRALSRLSHFFIKMESFQQKFVKIWSTHTFEVQIHLKYRPRLHTQMPRPRLHTQMPRSRIQTPDSRIQNLESRLCACPLETLSFFIKMESFQCIYIRHLLSCRVTGSPYTFSWLKTNLEIPIRISSWKSPAQSSFQNPDSRLQTPESRLQTPDSRLQTPESRI